MTLCENAAGALYIEVVLFWALKVKGQSQGHGVTGSITLHNNTSFRTAIAFHSHSLGGNSDESNTTWVRTLRVHSS